MSLSSASLVPFFAVIIADEAGGVLGQIESYKAIALAAVSAIGAVALAVVSTVWLVRRAWQGEVKAAQQKTEEAVAEGRREADDRVEQFREKLVRPEPVGLGNKRNAVIAVGLGGVGKTTLIRLLTHDFQAQPMYRTEKFNVHRGERRVTGNTHTGEQRTHKVYIADYAGENFGMLIRHLLLAQKVPESPLTYGHINSLLVLVDVRNPSREGAPDLKPEEEPDGDRIDRHLAEWSEVALDAVFGLLAKPTLRYVCMFINKADLVLNNTKSKRDTITARFQSLRERLSRRCDAIGEVKFRVIYGSAKTGDGSAELVQDLIEFSDELK